MRRKKTFSCSAAAAAAAADGVTGSTDLLWEILFRVPWKPLHQLKCVSKQWHALISDEIFRDSHFHRNHRNPNSLIFSNNLNDGETRIISFNTAATVATPPPIRVLNLDFLNRPNITVVQSCHGLLLCRQFYSHYFICNPITGDFTPFPIRRHHHRPAVYLAFEPSVSPRYKTVVVEKNSDSPRNLKFYVYKFKIRSRLTGPAVSVLTQSVLDIADGVYCNGAIHWCSSDKSSVYFDVDTRRLKNYPMPRFGMAFVDYFGESGGRLHLMLSVKKQTYNLHDCSRYDLFELIPDYSGWLLRHRVDLSPLQAEFPHIHWLWDDLTFKIVSTFKGNKSSMLVLILGKEAAVSYDPVDNTSTKLYEMDATSIDFDPIRNSLASHGGRLSGTGVLLHFENLVQTNGAN